MAHGLSVRSNRGHASRRNAGAGKQCIGGVGECSRNFDIERTQFIQRNAAITLRQRKNALTQIFGIRMRQCRMQSGLRIETRQSDIDAVGAGARNQAEIERRLGHLAERYFASASCVASSVFSLASCGWLWCRKRASSVPGKGSGFGKVTVRGSRCMPSTRNS